MSTSAATTTTTVDVLVIGAGLAGLTAAHQLRLQAPYLSVLVLEARDRIGGRAHSVPLPGVPAPYLVDAGASYLHGSKSNPVTKVIHEIGHTATPCPWDSTRLTALMRDGEPLPPDTLDDVWDLAEEFVFDDEKRARLIKAKHLAGSGGNANDVSLAQCIDAWLPDKIEHLAAKHARKHPRGPSFETAFGIVLHQMVPSDYAEDPEHLSGLWYDQDEDGDGVDLLLDSPGTSAIVAHLAHDVPLRLSTPVVRIEYSVPSTPLAAATSSDSRVRVHDASGGVYEAKLGAIVTVPLGVLKAGGIEFVPPLPHDKQAAIDKLAMGVLDKVFLVFERAFWDLKKAIFFNANDSGAHTCSIVVNTSYFLARGKPAADADAAASHPAVLQLFIGAAAARDMERRDDHQVLADAMAVLQHMFGGDLPQPIGHLITRWNAEPYSLGSYSHIGVGASGDEYTVMSQPLGDENCLMFAGEATFTSYPATLHGAYASGRREAARILRTL